MEPIPKKSLGQHWLFDEAVLDSIADLAEVSVDDTVLEVGPGLGTLTRTLSERAQKVIAVELDEKLAADLIKKALPKVEVVQADILKFDTTRLPRGYKVVANIPYYLTSHLIRVLLESANQPSVMVLLIQKEVAERVAAPAGELSILGVSAQLYADVQLGPVVPAALFTPPPKVDSQIVVLKRREQLVTEQVGRIMRIVKIGFSNPRKTLVNNLVAGGLIATKTAAAELLAKLQLTATVRAQELQITDWQALTESLASNS